MIDLEDSCVPKSMSIITFCYLYIKKNHYFALDMMNIECPNSDDVDELLIS
jgi:hypothetical protein